MSLLFFSKTDKRAKKPFFNPSGERASDESAAGSDQGEIVGTGVLTPMDTANSISYRKLRMYEPKQTLDSLLERLLRSALNTDPSNNHFIEQMLVLIKRHPQLVNGKTHTTSNNNASDANQKLLELISQKAQKNSDYLSVLKRVENLLRPQQNKSPRPTPWDRRFS